MGSNFKPLKSPAASTIANSVYMFLRYGKIICYCMDKIISFHHGLIQDKEKIQAIILQQSPRSDILQKIDILPPKQHDQGCLNLFRNKFPGLT